MFELEKIMKNSLRTILILTSTLFMTTAFAQDALEFSGDCTFPDKPSGVDGSTASEAQMIEFQKNMKAYLAEGNEFLACLEKEEDQMPSSATPEQQEEFKAKVTQTYNMVVDEMNSIADQFNTALRAYKSQNQ